MRIVSVTRKGQVTIPENIRKKLGIGIGSKLLVEGAGDKALVMKKVDMKHSWNELMIYCKKLAKEKKLTPERINKSIENARAEIWKEKYEKSYGR